MDEARRTDRSSPLVAALAQAVIEQHVRRAGLSPGPDAMSDPMDHEEIDGTAEDVVGSSRRGLAVIDGGRRADR